MKDKSAPVINDTQRKLEITYKDVTELVPYIRNARIHSDEQISQLMASIRKFGFNDPIELNGENGILAGHGRLQAAQRLGITKVPTVDLSHLSPTDQMAYIIANNSIALNAGWDMDLLKLEVSDLKAANFDMGTLALGIKTMASLLEPIATTGLTDDDAIPEAPEQPVTLPGDVWILGEHRLMCGDSTDLANIESLMDGQKADLIFTDPPYGVDFQQGAFCPTAGKKFRGTKIANDDLKGEDLSAFIGGVLLNLVSVSKHVPVYIWAPPLLPGAAIATGIKSAGIHIQSKVIWKKNTFVMGRSDYHWQHEECWYGYIGDKHPWYGGRDKGSVWDVKKMQKMELHPTQKPVELAEIAITNSSKGGDIVVDPFGGSGFTLIAAEKLGRRAFIMELESKYCDVMVKRWQEFTGKQAVNAATGQTFQECGTVV